MKTKCSALEYFPENDPSYHFLAYFDQFKQSCVGLQNCVRGQLEARDNGDMYSHWLFIRTRNTFRIPFLHSFLLAHFCCFVSQFCHWVKWSRFVWFPYHPAVKRTRLFRSPYPLTLDSHHSLKSLSDCFLNTSSSARFPSHGLPQSTTTTVLSEPLLIATKCHTQAR